ncbi:M protein repeat protein, partial [Cooperia oncophora]
RLKNELDQIKKEYEEKAARQKEESDTAIQDFKLKAEKKIAKIKAAAEKDVTSAKAELLLEVDQLRRTISERDRRIDELVVEKARTEQQLIGQREMEEELEQRRSKEKRNELGFKRSGRLLNDSVKSIERRIVELETENRLLDEKNKELTESKERSEARAEESDKNSKELEKKIKALEEANEEGFRKAAAKHDSDSKKAVRELQREVKQLYVELNEKTDALDMARTRISELESSSSKSVEEAVIQKQTHTDVDASPNYGVCTERFTDLTI